MNNLAYAPELEAPAYHEEEDTTLDYMIEILLADEEIKIDSFDNLELREVLADALSGYVERFKNHHKGRV